MRVPKHQRSKEEHKEKQPKKEQKEDQLLCLCVDEPTLLSFLVHSQQRDRGFHREDGEG